MALVPFHELRFDWSKTLDRDKFEQDLKKLKEKRTARTIDEKIIWYIQLVFVTFLIVVALYGSVAYIIVR